VVIALHLGEDVDDVAAAHSELVGGLCVVVCDGLDLKEHRLAIDVRRSRTILLDVLEPQVERLDETLDSVVHLCSLFQRKTATIPLNQSMAKRAIAPVYDSMPSNQDSTEINIK
jgi:hypothetical protein